MSMMNPSYQTVRLRLQRRSLTSNVSLQPHLSPANEGLDYSVTLPDSLMMSQQTRYFRPAAKLKMVSSHHPTGGVLEVDLPPPGFIRSAGTREYWWPMCWSWQKTRPFWRQIEMAGCYGWMLRVMMMMMMTMMMMTTTTTMNLTTLPCKF